MIRFYLKTYHFVCNTVTFHSVPNYCSQEGGPGLLLYMELEWWPFLISKGPIVSQDTNKLRRRQTKRHIQSTITENWLRTATIKIFSDRDGCERRASNWKQTWITIKMNVRIIPHVQYWRWPTHHRSSQGLDHLWMVMGSGINIAMDSLFAPFSGVTK